MDRRRRRNAARAARRARSRGIPKAGGGSRGASWKWPTQPGWGRPYDPSTSPGSLCSSPSAAPGAFAPIGNGTPSACPPPAPTGRAIRRKGTPTSFPALVWNGVSASVASRVRRPLPVPLPPARRPLRPGWVAPEFLPPRPCPVRPPLAGPAPSLLAIQCPQPAAPSDVPTSSTTADLAEMIVRRLEEDLTFSRHDPGALDRLIQGARKQQEKQPRQKKGGEIEDLRRLLNRQWEEVKTPLPSPTPASESAPSTQPGSEEESGLSPDPLPLGKQWALPKVVRTPFMQPPADQRKERGSRKRSRRSEPHSHGARSASSRGLSPPRRQERIDRSTQSAPASRASPVLTVRSVVRVVPPQPGVEDEKKKPGKEGSMTPPVPPSSTVSRNRELARRMATEFPSRYPLPAPAPQLSPDRPKTPEWREVSPAPSTIDATPFWAPENMEVRPPSPPRPVYGPRSRSPSSDDMGRLVIVDEVEDEMVPPLPSPASTTATTSPTPTPEDEEEDEAFLTADEAMDEE